MAAAAMAGLRLAWYGEFEAARSCGCCWKTGTLLRGCIPGFGRKAGFAGCMLGVKELLKFRLRLLPGTNGLFMAPPMSPCAECDESRR